MCSTKNITAYVSGTTWGRVNNDRFFIAGENGQFKILSECERRKYFSVEKLHTNYITFNAPEREETVREQQEVFQGLCVNDSKKNNTQRSWPPSPLSSSSLNSLWWPQMISPVWFDTAWRVQDCVKHERDWEKEQDRNIWTVQKDLMALETTVLKFSFKGTFQG